MMGDMSEPQPTSPVAFTVLAHNALQSLFQVYSRTIETFGLQLAQKDASIEQLRARQSELIERIEQLQAAAGVELQLSKRVLQLEAELQTEHDKNGKLSVEVAGLIEANTSALEQLGTADETINSMFGAGDDSTVELMRKAAARLDARDEMEDSELAKRLRARVQFFEEVVRSTNA